MPVPETTELLLLPDGQVLVHNLTTSVAAILSELAPEDVMMRQRANAAIARQSANDDSERD